MSDLFSSDIPRLYQSHLDHLKSSAISLDVIKERGYETIMGKTKLKEAGFSKAQQRATGILIPLHGVDGKVYGYQYRPDHPREDKRRGRLIKYENPTGSSVRLDVPPRCREQLGNPSVPIWFTEGIKKVDSLASAGVCAVGLTGVWGFKGKNEFGGTTFLADFDCIALKNRLTYLVFDSDYTSNSHVRAALERFREHLVRKGAKVRILQLPNVDDEKIGVDDYLAKGHTTKDLIGLEITDDKSKSPTKEKVHQSYCLEESRLCYIKHTEHGGKDVIPLCNFNAKITEVVTRDNGIEETKTFTIVGKEGNGIPLPTIEVPTSSFESLSWITAEWDTRAIISANQTAKGKLREAILLQSQDATRRNVYAHTGWREVDGQMAFFTSSGALGMPDVEVELENDLENYYLPDPPKDMAEALKESLAFLDIGRKEVLYPLWAAMYLAPLSEILDPAFTMFVVGPSGSYKSTVSALALNHYGHVFDEFHMPAAWRDTENKLEKLLFLAKDLPMVIDDWAPGQDNSKARELEVKAEHVIRAQGNRQGKGRLKSDTSSRKTYVPRGLLLTSGEQLPSGYSHTARIFSVEIDRGDLDLVKLSEAQGRKYLLSQAMSCYIMWLRDRWGDLKEKLPKQYRRWRDQARSEAQHPRLPGVISWLYAGLSLALDFMVEKGALDEEEAKQMAKNGWDIFVSLSAEQGGRVEEERPGKRFVEILRTLYNTGRGVFGSKDDDGPRELPPNKMLLGWSDGDGHFLLDQNSSYAAVRQFCQHGDQPFTFKKHAVWKDLKDLNYSVSNNGRLLVQERIYGQRPYIIKLRKSVLDGNPYEQKSMDLGGRVSEENGQIKKPEGGLI